MTTLAPILEGYFAERLGRRGASTRTVASYRDAFCLLLGFMKQRSGKAPANLDVGDLDAEAICAFLDHLERDRGNAISTCNARLAAVHSFFAYASFHCPEHAATIQRVLAIPTKRRQSTIVSFLDASEIDALLASPDRATWLGRRDHCLLLVAVQTGLRVSELTGLTRADAELDGRAGTVRCVGKGRKERRTPLTRPTAQVLRDWLSGGGVGGRASTAPLFPSRTGGRLSNDAVADLLVKYSAAAVSRCPSLANKHVTPHVLRHSCAMTLLRAKVDPSTISLFLGHASTKSTDVYLHADLVMKEQALARTAPHRADRHRYQAPDALLAFLEAL